VKPSVSIAAIASAERGVEADLVRHCDSDRR
jgi:hypothetical protein